MAFETSTPDYDAARDLQVPTAETRWIYLHSLLRGDGFANVHFFLIRAQKLKGAARISEFVSREPSAHNSLTCGDVPRDSFDRAMVLLPDGWQLLRLSGKKPNFNARFAVRDRRIRVMREQ